ncbi:MAG: sensor histidine kinase [Acidobacteriota bacterium]
MNMHVPSAGELGQRKLRILCVDDAPSIRRAIAAYLGDLGHTVEQAQDGTEGLERINSAPFDAVLLDLTMPGLSGLEVLRAASASHPDLPVIVISGTGAIQDVIAALRLGAWDFITKPIEDMAILEYALARALERASLITENQRHRERLEAQVRKRTAKLRAEIIERQAVETALRASLSEKEVLLKEVHHRVKNNLQVVTSLLSLQSLRFENPQLVTAFQDSQARVRAMALVHEKLYRSKDLCRIDFASYLRELTGFLIQAYSPKNLSIMQEIDSEEFFLSVDTAIPCGLILNELVTNSLKHAFPGRSSGTVSPRAWTEDGHAVLCVKDDGVGMPPGFDLNQPDTLGLQLVTNLARQLHGTLDMTTGPEGTAFTLRFPLPEFPSCEIEVDSVASARY